MDQVLCLGDIVGYGADPGPCLDEVASRAVAAVAGNHDRAAVGLTDLGWFNPYARAAAEWTAGQLASTQGRYLEALPLTTAVGEATLVHASPRAPAEWEYVISAREAQQAFGHLPTRLGFIGHSHLPGVFVLEPGGVSRCPGQGRVRLDPALRYLINVGSVGQPRDADPRASYALYDPEAGEVEIRRVPYDIDTARAKILAVGLPRLLGDRLLHGR